MSKHLFAALAGIAIACGGCATTAPARNVSPLILISVDGLRPTDVNAQQMPVLHALGQAWVRADGMRPSYPALTFPNHYTLVTGLRPNHHGIVHNTMRDASLGDFRPSLKPAVGDGRWWKDGTPVWVSAERAGIRTATMFWPGSEAAIKGVRPQEWREYADDTSAAANARTVANWLDAPLAQRPSFVTLYFDQADAASHDFGPDSAAAVSARGEVDAAIGQLLGDLAARGQLDAVNIVVVSDHGFETVPDTQRIKTSDMVSPELAETVSDGQVITFAPRRGRTQAAEQALLGKHDGYECWRKRDMPARLQYGSHPRIPAIVCQMDPGWDAMQPAKVEWFRKHVPGHVRGSHGYDPDLPSMRATFIARGPAFRQQVRLPVFDNVNVYPLLMRLLKLHPQRNDGDIAPLLQALQDTQ